MRYRILCVAGIAAVGLAVFPGQVLATHVQPRIVSGNPSCRTLLGTSKAVELKVQPVVSGTYSGGGLSVTITVRNTLLGQVFDWTSSPQIDAVFAKGGDNGNLYSYAPPASSDTGLHAPLNTNSAKWYGLSHVSFCLNPQRPPSAGLSVDHIAESVDPVNGDNTVVYTIHVANAGPDQSGPVTLSLSQPQGGSITGYRHGTDWTCSGTGASAQCTRASLAAGSPASDVEVDVLAPDQTTTIKNRAEVSQSGGTQDPNALDNVSEESTDVTASTNCPAGQMTCGFGTLVFNQISVVQAGPDVPNLDAYLTGIATHPATQTSGQGNWGMSAPRVPDSICPVALGSSTLTRCTFQENLNDILSPYVDPFFVTLELRCYIVTCPNSPVGTLIMVIDEGNGSRILPECDGGAGKCYEQSFTAQYMVVHVRNLHAGDPKIAGICVGGGC